MSPGSNKWTKGGTQVYSSHQQEMPALAGQQREGRSPEKGVPEQSEARLLLQFLTMVIMPPLWKRRDPATPWQLLMPPQDAVIPNTTPTAEGVRGVFPNWLCLKQPATGACPGKSGVPSSFLRLGLRLSTQGAAGKGLSSMLCKMEKRNKLLA